MVCDTPPSQDAFTHQICNSYLKAYKRYSPDSMQFLETKSEVKFKVTVTQIWYVTLRHPKMHPHTKFEIPNSKNIGDMLLKTRSEVKVTVTQKCYATLHHSKMHQHTKFWNFYLKEYRIYAPDTKRDGRTDGAITICLPKFLWGALKNTVDPDQLASDEDI